MNVPILDEAGQVASLDVSKSMRRGEGFRWKLWAASLPPITHSLPAATGEGKDAKNKQIAINWTVFASQSRPLLTHLYAKSAIYAYQCLLLNSNIAETGTARIHATHAATPVVRRYIEAAGLEAVFHPNIGAADAVPGWTDKLYSMWDPVLDAFDYRLHLDTDLWLLQGHPEQRPVDFGRVCHVWRRAEPKGRFFRNELTNPEFQTQETLHIQATNRFLSSDTARRESKEQTLAWIREHVPEMTTSPKFAGQVFGWRSDAAWRDIYRAFWEEHRDRLHDDELLMQAFLKLHPSIKRAPVISRRLPLERYTSGIPLHQLDEPKPWEWLTGAKKYCCFVNVGTGKQIKRKFPRDVRACLDKNLAMGIERFEAAKDANVRKSSPAGFPEFSQAPCAEPILVAPHTPAPVNAAEARKIRHYRECNYAFIPPITYPLPAATGAETRKHVAVIMTLFANRRYPLLVHLQAKNAIYAYQCLLLNSNIAETGTVRICATREATPIVRPYIESAGLSSVFHPDLGPKDTFPARTDKLYSWWIPEFQDYTYHMFLDADMWLCRGNAHHVPVDFAKVVRYWRQFGDNCYMTLQVARLFKKRYLNKNLLVDRATSKDLLRLAREWEETFFSEGVKAYPYRDVLACITAVYARAPWREKLRAFWLAHGKVLGGSDEGFWNCFLRLHPEILDAQVCHPHVLMLDPVSSTHTLPFLTEVLGIRRSTFNYFLAYKDGVMPFVTTGLSRSLHANNSEEAHRVRAQITKELERGRHHFHASSDS